MSTPKEELPNKRCDFSGLHNPHDFKEDIDIDGMQFHCPGVTRVVVCSSCNTLFSVPLTNCAICGSKL